VSALDVTVVVPIDSPDAEIEQVVEAFAGQLDRLGKSWECVLVFDGVRGKASRPPSRRRAAVRS